MGEDTKIVRQGFWIFVLIFKFHTMNNMYTFYSKHIKMFSLDIRLMIKTVSKVAPLQR
jgi:hypothetical protein